MTEHKRMAIIGFTGTRQGMTELQRLAFQQFLLDARPTEFHHGDCVGADAQAHADAEKVCPDGIVIHPPNGDPLLRAHCFATRIRAPRAYMARNRDIVNACQILVAAPYARKRSGGTWATVDYARRQNKPILFVWSDGTLQFWSPEP